MKILVVTDTHYRPGADPAGTESRWRAPGPLLLRKALNRLRHMDVEVDLVVLLGDLLDDGLAPGGEEALAQFAAEAQKAQRPLLAVPGNHDGDPGRVARVFNCPPGLHVIGGYGFLVFHDTVAAGDVTTRSPAGLRLPLEAAASRPDLPLIALQHNPIHPDVNDPGYPYMPTNTEAIRDSYAAAGVILSLSGHYHPGQPLHRDGPVACCTVPAACVAPYAFALVTLTGREVAVEPLQLRHDVPGLVDGHSHTELAYCGEDISLDWNIALSRRLGVSTLCVTEHAFQLYFDAETAWSWRWKTDGDLVRHAFRHNRERMTAYRAMAQKHRGPAVQFGLEVDLIAGGRLLLAETDAAGWDLLVGAVHQLAVPEPRLQADAERLFMHEVEQLLQHPIRTLAHPFRWFRRARMEPPTRLYDPVARLLAAAGVAAEINFHTNRPDPRFIEACLHHGCTLALASDGHNRAELGEFHPHLELLRQSER